jgi:hypothetical protein
MSAESPLARLQQIATYRCVCKRLRHRGKNSMFLGGVCLWATWMTFQGLPADYIFLGIWVAEILLGFWIYTRPSAEGVIIEGLLSLLFGAGVVGRQVLILANNGDPSWFWGGLGVLIIWGGIRHIRSYPAVKVVFEEKPTPDQIEWLEDLVKEIRRADASTDPDAVTFATIPQWKAKLLGDTAILVDRSDQNILVTSRFAVEWVTTGRSLLGKSVQGKLHVGGSVWNGAMDPHSLANFRVWKGVDPAPEHGEPVDERYS